MTKIPFKIMPNHCGNRLTVSGDFKERQLFVDGVKSLSKDGEVAELLDFEKILPTPSEEELKRLPPSRTSVFGMFGMFGVSGWYEWRCDNWGTKWNSYDVELKHNEKETVYIFQTAWAPPNDKLMRAFARKFPNVKLDLRFAERGCEFYGYWTPEKTETWKFQNDDVITVDEDEGEYRLRDGLQMYDDLYQMSG